MTNSISTADLNTALQSANPPVVFDVRKKPAFDAEPSTLPGATWQIHDEVQNWAAQLPTDQPVIVYCVHGHEVSQNAAQALRDLGFDACYLEGGYEGWQQAGLLLDEGRK